MGFVRLMYRRKHILFLLLCATTIWLFYHLLSFTSDHQVVHSTDQISKVSTEKDQKNVQDTVRKATDVHNEKDRGVLQPPPRKEEIQPPPQGKVTAKKPSTSPVKHEDKASHENSKSHRNGKKASPDQSKERRKDNSTLNQEKINISQKVNSKKEGNLDKVLKIGEKLKNKTLDLGEKVKNKTIEKLSQLGVLKTSNLFQFIFVPDVWKIQLTLDDLSQVMKDTDHLSKQEKIDVNYPKLLPVKSNVTEGNLTVALRKVVMKNRVGFCDCRDYECMCCSRVTHKRIQVNTTACANITFMSKSQELDFKFSMDKKLVYQKLIPVEPAPKICLGSHSKVADICVRFLNTTSKVTILEDHKFLVVGCLEFSISLFNKTVSAFPVDCFQMPSHQHHKKEEDGKKIAQDFGNWVP
ncbi:uncharacterized protein LOC125665516 [Ostrea edulis]|uniref:uncharacterized protein LOC125665516 n=1 Tax=Ostrea edulis TaxID=37623 RepID=UPI0020941930|nr:uncharacterized protein LOC125665516 [Ostrea edulis]